MGAGSRGHERAIFVLLDGAGAERLEALVQKGELPNVARAFPPLGRAVTVFPSVTTVAYAPFVTGRFPGRNGIPGLRWFDRGEYARSRLSIHRFRDYCGPGSYLADRDLEPSAPTLYELVRPSMNVFGMVSRGAGPWRNALYFTRVAYAWRLKRTGDWRPIDARGELELLRAVSRGHRFIFYAFLSVDGESHRFGPDDPHVVDAFRRFDATMGALLATLDARGERDRTLLLLSADHGHSAVERHLDLEGFFEKRGLRTLYFPSLVGANGRCDAAVMVGGNAMAHVYLPGPAGWAAPPDETAIFRAHPTLVEDLLAEDAVHVVAWRGEDGAVHARAREGEVAIRLEDGTVRQRLVRGADPFGYANLSACASLEAHLGETVGGDYPDAPLQLAQLFSSVRTGDLVVSARPGYDLRDRFEDPEHRSTHGSLHKSHMVVPLLSSHPLEARPARTVDVFPTVLSLLGEETPAAIDGRALA